MNATSTVEHQIEGSFSSAFFREFLTNSAHFPMTNLILEALTETDETYFLEPDPYILLACALVQTFALSFLRRKNVGYIFLGNFVGAILYVALEAPLEGAKFFAQPQHYAYWYFSLAIGLFQFLKEKNLLNFSGLFEIGENTVRTLIPLCMYVLFEAKGRPFMASLPTFFSDPAHVFLTIVLGLLGLLIGFSEAQNTRVKLKLKDLAIKLKDYSSWSLGKRVLNAAVRDENIFDIKRVSRAIVFLDIRGFTKWSEKESPENVVNMLNDYYLEAEKILGAYKILKMKYTADEIMIVFEDYHEAAQASLVLRDHLNAHLALKNLTVGGGIHYGAVVEGLIGSQDHKLFDVMGDTVNTAKRLCESAKGNEILISSEFITLSEGRAFTTEGREVVLKGKEKTHQVFPLQNYFIN